MIEAQRNYVYDALEKDLNPLYEDVLGLVEEAVNNQHTVALIENSLHDWSYYKIDTNTFIDQVMEILE